MRGGVFVLLRKILHLYKLHKGGILIEFTFSIPVCITLLLFVSDHYRFYELKNKIRTSAYLLGSIIQQIANTRTNKQLTKADLNRATFASCLNFFHTKSMFYPWPFGIYYVARFHYVKRESDNNYKYNYWECSIGSNAKSVDAWMWNSKLTSANKSSNEIEAIHPDLICYKNGEERLLITCFYGATKNTNFTKSKLGLFLLEPKFNLDGNFVYKFVITPKPGLFPPAWK